jgi:hypothetical protein
VMPGKHIAIDTHCFPRSVRVMGAQASAHALFFSSELAGRAQWRPGSSLACILVCMLLAQTKQSRAGLPCGSRFHGVAAVS